MYEHKVLNKICISYDRVNVGNHVTVYGNLCDHSKTKKGIKSTYMTDMEL
jgi:hypothetical protein